MQSPRPSSGSGATPHRRRPRIRSPPAKRRRANTTYYSSPPSSPSPSLSSSPPPATATAPTSGPPAAKWFRRPSVVWYRGNDLRVEDHPALLAAAQRGGPVVPLFVWDPSDGFGVDLGDVKQWWLRKSLLCLQRDLRRLGVQLYTRTGQSTDELRAFLKETGADAVFWNRCYEPDLLTRDEKLRVELAQEGLTAESFKAELLVEPWELSNTEVDPCFPTFHAYMCAWMTLPPPPQPLPWPSRLQRITSSIENTPIDELGFECPSDVEDTISKVWTPGSQQAKLQLDLFLREAFPAFGEGRCRRHFDGTSKLSPHIRFGELSPRRMYHTTRLHVWRWKDQVLSPASRNMQNMKTPKEESVKDIAKFSSTSHINPQNGTMAEAGREEKKATASRSLDAHLVHAQGGQETYDSSDTSRSEQNYPTNNPAQPSTRTTIPGLPHISLSARAFLKNLCLRDFSYHVLFHNPDFNAKPLVPEFCHFPWAEDDGSFDAWRVGKTGYPIVDAAMRELKSTGWVHNGMRFLLACFLTKYLLLPWTRGLKEFYGLLIDGDHSANALGWQWTSGSNTDAFPVGCLVSPVKAASRHDPTGSYVRRWVPELAKLSTEYLHRPWKASEQVLKDAGIEIGVTYPSRVVQLNDARRRALDAFRVMKQIFVGSRVFRGIFDDKDEVVIKEWPAEELEVLEDDDTAPFSGKKGLLPSLWALLQGEQPAAYLSGSSSGNDPLIAMDTASLTEGALAMPLDDHHESIEHALITGHEPGPSSETIAAATEAVENGRRLMALSYAHEKRRHSPLLDNEDDDENMHADALDETLKYPNSFNDTDKNNPPSSSQLPASSGVLTDSVQNIASPIQPPATGALHADSGSGNISNSHALETGSAPHSYPPQRHQQMANFQQLQLQQFHQIQHFHQLRQQQQQQQDPCQQQHHRQRRLQPFQHTGHPQKAPVQSAAHSMMEGVYGAGGSNAPLPMTSVAGVPMTAPPVMMGPATSAPDIGVNQMFSGNDSSNLMYSPQFGMNPFYSYQPVMPVMNAHSVNGSERTDVPGPSTTSNGAQVALSGVLPMGYGMYGNGMFDASLLGNSFPPNAGPYRPVPGSSQQQAHRGPQTHYGFAPHPMYLAHPHADVLRSRGTGNIMPGAVPGPVTVRPTVLGTATLPANSVTVAAAAAAVAAGGREVSAQERTPVTPNQSADGRLEIPSPRKGQGNTGKGSPQAKEALRTSSNGSGSYSDALNRGTGKSRKPRTPGRTIGRSKRVSSSSGAGRSRTDGRGSATRGRGGEGNSSGSRGQRDTTSVTSTTLEKRQEILSSVLAEKDHEYFNFANYLAGTCELTSNTDRQTSKDYIRLCNLKDEFHRQCTLDNEKLKIYRIKNFFSKILKLEVTGEWDRHNHGGVRGPYVYGIRMRRPRDPP